MARRITKSRIRREFRTGQIDNQEASASLQYLGLSYEAASAMTDEWQDEMDAEERAAIGNADPTEYLNAKG